MVLFNVLKYQFSVLLGQKQNPIYLHCIEMDGEISETCLKTWANKIETTCLAVPVEETEKICVSYFG